MHHKRRAPLSFEQLENRCVPAATIFSSAGNLTILGDNAGNDIEVVQTAPSAYNVIVNTVLRGNFTVTRAMTISSGSGADDVSVSFSSSTALTSLSITTNNGADDVYIFATTSAPLIVLNGGAGALSVNTGTGNDTIDLNGGTVLGSSLGIGGNVQLNGGPGADTALVGGVAATDFVGVSGNLALIQVNTATIENTTVSGSLSGTNAADLTLANILSVNATSTAGTFGYAGGTGTDAVTLAGDVTGNVNIATSTGNDTVTTGTESAIAGDLTISTVDGADSVTLSGNVAGDVTADLGSGDNSFALMSTVPGVDLDGDLSVTTGSGMDTIALSAAFFGSGVHGDTTLNTGAGNDSVSLFVCLDENFTFDLGSGDDTLTAFLTLIGVGPGMSAFSGNLGTGADLLDFGVGGDGNGISSDTVTLNMGSASPGMGDGAADIVTGLAGASTAGGGAVPLYLNCDPFPLDSVDGGPCP